MSTPERPTARSLSMPACGGCGTSVATPGELCSACAVDPRFTKQQGPQPSIVTAPQPIPAYHPSRRGEQ